MSKIITTSGYIQKQAQSEPSKRFWGNITVQIWVPQEPVQVNPSDANAFSAAYKEREQRTRQYAEQYLQTLVEELNRNGRGPGFQYEVSEATITGDDNQIMKV